MWVFSINQCSSDLGRQRSKYKKMKRYLDSWSSSSTFKDLLSYKVSNPSFPQRQQLAWWLVRAPVKTFSHFITINRKPGAGEPGAGKSGPGKPIPVGSGPAKSVAAKQASEKVDLPPLSMVFGNPDACISGNTQKIYAIWAVAMGNAKPAQKKQFQEGLEGDPDFRELVQQYQNGCERETRCDKHTEQERALSRRGAEALKAGLDSTPGPKRNPAPTNTTAPRRNIALTNTSAPMRDLAPKNTSAPNRNA
jgi:hypothetical protein